MLTSSWLNSRFILILSDGGVVMASNIMVGVIVAEMHDCSLVYSNKCIVGDQVFSSGNG